MRKRMLIWFVLALLAVPLVPRSIASAQECAAGLPPRLMVGQTGRVVISDGTGNNLRAYPSQSATVIGVLADGETFTVVGGPQCVESRSWWQVRRDSGEIGWTAEGDQGTYWLEPWPPQQTTITPGQAGAVQALLAYLSAPLTDEALRPYTINLETGAKLPLGSITTGDNGVRWSPDGRAVALTGAEGDIYVVDVVSGVATNVTRSPETVNGWPTWSPDSRRLAFTVEDGANSDIFSMLLPDGEPINLTENEAMDSWPAWSPDGTRIAFASDRGGNTDIYVMSAADGANPVRLTTMATFDSRPTWSPDGLYIAFVAEDAQGTSVVYVVSADGATLTPVSPEGSIAHDPVWSRDSQRLAYVGEFARGSDRDGVFIVERSGANLQRVTQEPVLAQGVTWIGSLNWLAAALNQDSNYELVALDVASGEQIDVSNTPQEDELWPRMQPGVVSSLVFQGGPAASTPSANTGPQDLALIYDANMPVFTLQNVSGGPLNLAPLSFTGAGRTIQADIWAPYAASPLTEFKAFGCLMIWKYGLPDQAAPPECGDSRQAWVSDNTYIFWTGESFTVNYNGVPVATCLSAADRCDVDLP